MPSPEVLSALRRAPHRGADRSPDPRQLATPRPGEHDDRLRARTRGGRRRRARRAVSSLGQGRRGARSRPLARDRRRPRRTDSRSLARRLARIGAPQAVPSRARSPMAENFGVPDLRAQRPSRCSRSGSRASIDAHSLNRDLRLVRQGQRAPTTAISFESSARRRRAVAKKRLAADAPAAAVQRAALDAHRQPGAPPRVADGQIGGLRARRSRPAAISRANPGVGPRAVVTDVEGACRSAAAPCCSPALLDEPGLPAQRTAPALTRGDDPNSLRAHDEFREERPLRPFGSSAASTCAHYGALSRTRKATAARARAPAGHQLQIGHAGATAPANSAQHVPLGVALAACAGTRRRTHARARGSRGSRSCSRNTPPADQAPACWVGFDQRGPGGRPYEGSRNRYERRAALPARIATTKRHRGDRSIARRPCATRPFVAHDDAAAEACAQRPTTCASTR